MMKIFNSVIALLILFTSCSKESSTTDCFKATLVAEICGQAVFQIDDPKFQDLGEDAWTDANGKKLDNVFVTNFDCVEMDYLGRLARPTLVGMQMNLSISSVSNQGTCVVCLALLSNPPKKRLEIQVNDTNCEPVK